MMAGVDKTAGEDIPGVGSGIEMLSWWRRAEALDSMDPPIPWFHLLLVLLPWMHRLTIRKLRKTAMQVAVRPEDVASSGRIAGQVHTAAAIPQDRPPYEVMSVTPSSYRHIKSETDIGASETTQRWAWSEHIVTIFSRTCTYIGFCQEHTPSYRWYPPFTSRVASSSFMSPRTMSLYKQVESISPEPPVILQPFFQLKLRFLL